MKSNLSRDEVRKDVDLMLWAADLAMIRRYLDMTYWELEAREEYLADSARSGPRLESVADHSWHLCDCILLLSPRFPGLDSNKCLQLAVLHDKLELLIGDLSPMGQSGTGHDGTAYNSSLASAKRAAEIEALSEYVAALPEEVARAQRSLLEDYLHERSPEAKFVRAVDRLQVYTWLIRKKGGRITNAHLTFSIRYLREGVARFPALLRYSDEFEERLLAMVAKARGVTISELELEINLQNIRQQTTVKIMPEADLTHVYRQ